MPDDIGADAITGCLRTESNTLSVWACEADTVDRDEAVLAIASILKRVDTFDVVVVPRGELEKRDIPLETTLGDTPIKDLSPRHRDMVSLGGDRLIQFARLIAGLVRLDGAGAHIRKTKKQVRDMLSHAIDSGRVTIDRFPAEVREDLEAYRAQLAKEQTRR